MTERKVNASEYGSINPFNVLRLLGRRTFKSTEQYKIRHILRTLNGKLEYNDRVMDGNSDSNQNIM